MIKIVILSASVVLLSACSTVEELVDKSIGEQGVVTVEDRSSATQENIIAQDNSSFEVQNYSGTNAAAKDAVTALKEDGVVFVLNFSYDGYEIDEKSTKEIIKHANFMRDNPQVDLTLTGHADERGTREYNLALGENRALSVKEILGLYDLTTRVEVISFGEEKPISQAHDEQGWQQNRRVEFIYK